MPKRRAPINSEPVNQRARTDLQSLIDDYKIPSCVEHVKRFARLTHGKRGIVGWLEHLRLTGTLLATLDDEEWQLFLTQYLAEHTSTPSQPPQTRTLLPKPTLLVEEGLF